MDVVHCDPNDRLTPHEAHTQSSLPKFVRSTETEVIIEPIRNPTSWSVTHGVVPAAIIIGTIVSAILFIPYQAGGFSKTTISIGIGSFLLLILSGVCCYFFYTSRMESGKGPYAVFDRHNGTLSLPRKKVVVPVDDQPFLVCVVHTADDTGFIPTRVVRLYYMSTDRSVQRVICNCSSIRQCATIAREVIEALGTNLRFDEIRAQAEMSQLFSG